MQSGFNTNVRHRGVLFHVQTEDSGLAHPHVITHLYYGGTILASEKTQYTDLLDAPDLPQALKARMEKQHAAMLERLRSGELDAQIRERLASVTGRRMKAPEAGEVTAAGGVAAAGSAPTASGAAAAAGASPETPAPAAASASAAVRDAAEGAPAGSGERPLDEMILDYLVERARQRKRRAP